MHLKPDTYVDEALKYQTAVCREEAPKPNNVNRKKR
jgi:hypothetical protein